MSSSRFSLSPVATLHNFPARYHVTSGPTKLFRLVRVPPNYCTVLLLPIIRQLRINEFFFFLSSDIPPTGAGPHHRGAVWRHPVAHIAAIYTLAPSCLASRTTTRRAAAAFQGLHRASSRRFGRLARTMVYVMNVRQVMRGLLYVHFHRDEILEEPRSTH